MNLRDKLRAVDSPRKPAVKAAEEPAFTDCHVRTERRPLSAFPGGLEIRRETVMLMQGEEMPEPFDPRRILYLDTETTGLGGGAGTVAFIVGAGWLSGDGFTLEQYVLRDYPEEPFQLKRLEERLRDFDVICTFNGKTFDLPLLRTRFLMNRMRPLCLEKPHIDLLHIARRVWKLRLGRCNLTRLEEAILGYPREDDLPGSEAPERFFRYLETGEFALLDDVLRHNGEDIASLCVLLAHMCAVYEHPEEIRFGEDLYSMGRALERAAHVQEARRCYRLVSGGRLRAESQARLAHSYRRAGQREEAVRVWQGMIDRREGGVTPYIELAKHYEHRAGDPAAALEMTRRAMALLSEPSLRENETVQAAQNALQCRYDRLKRRLAGKEK